MNKLAPMPDWQIKWAMEHLYGMIDDGLNLINEESGDVADIIYDVQNNKMYIKMLSFIKEEHESINAPPTYIDTVGWLVVEIRKPTNDELDKIRELGGEDVW
jgi:hypothetical protein